MPRNKLDAADWKTRLEGMREKCEERAARTERTKIQRYAVYLEAKARLTTATCAKVDADSLKGLQDAVAHAEQDYQAAQNEHGRACAVCLEVRTMQRIEQERPGATLHFFSRGITLDDLSDVR